jgi:hypothetical protein
LGGPVFDFCVLACVEGAAFLWCLPVFPISSPLFFFFGTVLFIVWLLGLEKKTFALTTVSHSSNLIVCFSSTWSLGRK